MNAFRHWLFCTLFPDEAGTLMRYRLNIHSLDRWFCGHIPAVAEAARWLKHYSEAKDDPNDPPSGLDISGLRAQLMAAAIISRIATGQEYIKATRFLRAREIDMDANELSQLLAIFGVGVL